MSKTSAAVKNRYAAKAYDRFSLMLKKGEKEQLQSHAQQMGESLNGFINRAIDNQLEQDGNTDADGGAGEDAPQA